jgi:hypothetical protein
MELDWVDNLTDPNKEEVSLLLEIAEEVLTDAPSAWEYRVGDFYGEWYCLVEMSVTQALAMIARHRRAILFQGWEGIARAYLARHCLKWKEAWDGPE